MRSPVAVSYAVRVSRIVAAPLRFVYDWCTDFREGDYRISGSKSRRRILEKTKERVIYTTKEKGKSAGSASIVTLHPPDTWHVDSIGDQRDVAGDYRLARLADGRTKLDIVFRVKQKSSAAPSRAEFFQHINAIWNKYATTLEKDYRSAR